MTGITFTLTNFGVIIGGCVLAFRLRKAPKAFNEAKAMAFTTYNFLIWLLLLFGVYQSNPRVESWYAVRSSGTLIMMIPYVTILFVPKLRAVWRLERRKAAVRQAPSGAQRGCFARTVATHCC